MTVASQSPSHRTGRATPTQLKELRMLRVAVLHPDDADGRQLTQQLQRIGCQVQAFWPPVATLPENTDVVFLAVQPEITQNEFEWVKAENAPTCIAVVNYENPTIVETVLRLGAKAVLPAPVRSFGLLSVLVIARAVDDRIQGQASRIRKLEAKLTGARRIAEAKNILMRTRNVSESQAYDLIRDQAMSKRVTTEDIAAAIVNANEILSLGT
ncbi:MAG: ANTAR domain-containing protein [Burkholderiales bacterium]|nr:ANTAR domain-containing protein [Burkholderiales bacterium]